MCCLIDKFLSACYIWAMQIRTFTIDGIEFQAKADQGVTTVCDDKGTELFSYSYVQLAITNMTRDEIAHAVNLCVEARLHNGWKGDILNPEEYHR